MFIYILCLFRSQEEVVEEASEAPLQEREDPPVARVPSPTPMGMDNPPLMPRRSRQRRQRSKFLTHLRKYNK